MKHAMITRATQEFATSGRTLEGIAYYYGRTATVSDDGGRTTYREAYGRAAANKSLRERGTVPLLYHHSMMPGMPGWSSKWSGESFGPVTFTPTGEGLAFRTTLVNSDGADDMLDLIDRGKVGDVSIGMYPVKFSMRAGVKWHDEIALAELSLAPVGTGQHPGAKVLAVRTEVRPDELAQRIALLKRNLH